jgi:hypothetical protein
LQQSLRIVIELAEALVALGAEDSADALAAGLLCPAAGSVMVDMPSVGLATRRLGPTDRAPAILR